MNWKTPNVGLKLISVALATVTWFSVKSFTSDSRAISGVPLEIKTKADLVVLQNSADTVTVVVRGTRDDVRQVSRQDLSAVIDLTRDERRGELNIKLSPKAIRHSRRVQVTQVDPSEVDLNIDEIVERELSVEPQFTGDLPQGVVVERVQTRPESVRLKGPRTTLIRLKTAPTLPIDLTDRSTSFRERVELSPLPFVNGLPQRRWVEVDVRIGPAPPIDSATGRGVEGTP